MTLSLILIKGDTMTGRRQTAVGYPFPKTPERWGAEEKQFAQGVHDLFDQIFGRLSPQKLYPVGIIVFTGSEQAPFSFGKWTEVPAGIANVYAWKRTA